MLAPLSLIPHLPCTPLTSFIAIVGAGRQSKSIHTTHTTHIDFADALTGLPDVQFAKDMPVAQSPVQKPLVLEDKEVGHSSASGCKEWTSFPRASLDAGLGLRLRMQLTKSTEISFLPRPRSC